MFAVTKNDAMIFFWVTYSCAIGMEISPLQNNDLSFSRIPVYTLISND